MIRKLCPDSGSASDRSVYESKWRACVCIVFVACTIASTIAVVSEDHKRAVIGAECVRSGQQWVDGDCVRARK